MWPGRAQPEWLIGGGAMGELIRSTDWSTTAFGPRASWPASLRTVVNLIVGCQFPMALLWGRELLFLYNDAYRHVAAERHPRALGRSTREVWPEVWALNEPIFAAVMDKGETVYLEDRLFPIDRHGHREHAYFTICYSPVRADDGAVAGTLVTLLETTERVRRHREQQQRLRGSFENVALGIAEVGTDGRIQNVNRRLGVLLGYEPHEFLGMSVQELTAPEDRDSSRELNGRLMRGELDTFQCEKRYLKKGGSPIWARVTVSSIRDATGAVFRAIGTVEDVTERKQVEEALRRALAKAEAGGRILAALMGSLPEGITICDAAGNLEMVSRHGQELLGGAHVGKTIQQVVRDWAVYRPDRHEPMPIDELPLVRALKGEIVQDFEIAEISSEGRELPLLCNAAPIRDESGQVVGGIVAWRDITERKRVEAALRRSEERLRLAQQVARIGSFEFYPQTNTSKWSPELEALHGLPSGGYDGTYQQWATLVHPEDLYDVERCLREAIHEGAFEAEWRIVWPDGSVRWVAGRGKVFHDDDGRPVLLLGVNVDITERKRNEQELREANDRLTAENQRKSEFLAMLSHELRNPLAPIKNSLYILDRATPGGSRRCVRRTSSIDRFST